MNIRQIAPAAALTTVLLGAAAPAMATPEYPPVTPTATESSVGTQVLGQQVASNQDADGLPVTGSQIALASGVGGALVVAGAGAVVMARKRSTAQR